MGITVFLIIKEAAAFHDPGYISVQFMIRHNMVFPDSLPDDLSHRKPGGQAGIGVLEDDLNLRTERAQFPG